jgi:hypothetical protein
MSGLADKLRREAGKGLLTATFFAIGFFLLILHNRLLTRGSGIEIAGFARALVGGLIVAKVLLTMDLLPLVNAFPHKPIVHNIVWKSSLYVAGSVVFLYIEPFVKSVFRGAGLYASHSRAWHEILLPRTWATVIWLATLMVGFVTMQELSRAIGKDQLKRLFFGHRKPVTERGFRDAA